MVIDLRKVCLTIVDAGDYALHIVHLWWYKAWPWGWLEPAGVVQVVHVWAYTCRCERGKIASISCSSTTTPASKSQLVRATIPEYDWCSQFGEATAKKQNTRGRKRHPN